MPLHTVIENILSEVEANRQDAIVVTRGISEQQFNWHPAPAAWSMAQCFTHLTLVTSLDLAKFAAAIQNGKDQKLFSPGPYSYGPLTRWFVRSMEPPAKFKFKAPKVYVPPADATLATSLIEYQAGLDKFAALVREASGLDLARIKIQSPAASWLKMPLGARFQLLTAHDRRHLWQALQLTKHPEFPAS